jgi:hypothetical protein
MGIIKLEMMCKRLWHILTYYTSICLEEPRKPSKLSASRPKILAKFHFKFNGGVSFLAFMSIVRFMGLIVA